MSKTNMNNYKLKKTSKLIPFRSGSQNSFISVKSTLSILLATEEHFANAMFYIMKNNITNIISRDLDIQLGLLKLHKTTSKNNSQPLSTTSPFLDNDSRNKVTENF